MAKEQRFPELDFFRGIGIAMMVVFHFVFDLFYFGLSTVQPYEGFWLIFQRTTATLLLLLVGISLSISYDRAQLNGEKSLFLKFFKRSLFLGMIALAITLATWVYPGKGFILFGIIHLIALSIFLGYFFQRFKFFNLVLGLTLISAGLFLGFNHVTTEVPFLLWLGIPPANFFTLDYFPLLPWFGIVLIGIFLGKQFYPKAQRPRSFTVPEHRAFKVLSWAGKQSLWIYMIHQLFLVGIIQLYLWVLK